MRGGPRGRCGESGNIGAATKRGRVERGRRDPPGPIVAERGPNVLRRRGARGGRCRSARGNGRRGISRTGEAGAAKNVTQKEHLSVPRGSAPWGRPWHKPGQPRGGELGGRDPRGCQGRKDLAPAPISPRPGHTRGGQGGEAGSAQPRERGGATENRGRERARGTRTGHYLSRTGSPGSPKGRK